MNRKLTVKLLRIVRPKGESLWAYRTRISESIRVDAESGIRTNPLVQANTRFVH